MTTMNQNRKNLRGCFSHGIVTGLAAAAFVCVIGPLPAADDFVPLASSAALAISDVTVGRTQVARYETLEIAFRMEGQWENP